MQTNLKATLKISRIVDGGPEELVFSQVVARENEINLSMTPFGTESKNDKYTVPISFRDLTAPTGVPIEYKLGYTYEAFAPDGEEDQILQYYFAITEITNREGGSFEPMPVLIQERMDTAIEPTFEGGAAASASA